MNLRDNFEIYFKPILIIGICILFLSCKKEMEDNLPEPRIESGIARFSGKIINSQLKQGEPSTPIKLYIPNPVTAEPGNFETNPGNDGSFHFDVPVEYDKAIGVLSSALLNQNIFVYLTTHDEIRLEISLDEAGNARINGLDNNELTSEDMVHILKVFEKMVTHVSPERIPRYNMLIEDFIPFEIKSLERKLDIAKNDPILSGSAKQFITNEFKLIYLSNRLMDYTGIMKTDYMRYNDPEDWDKFTPVEPDISYYALLKYFNLNDPQYLYNENYSKVMQNLLSNKILNIPSIKETRIEDWLKEVKKIMAVYIGSETGIFYDVLAANAYAGQFNNEIKPLSDKQKENITKYFKNEEVTKILFRKNEEIMKLDEERQRTISIINTTPAVRKEALMDAIISKYNEKAVIVDFWATWCMPCLDAMKANRTVRNEMKDKDIVFVYITDITSPEELWREKIKLIEGEHYYLTLDEFDFIMGNFGFTGIPCYLFYDKKGILKNKTTGYPGAEKMKKMIEELLP